MDIQLIIVVILILAAAFYIARTIRKSIKGHACEAGSCGCSVKSVKKV